MEEHGNKNGNGFVWKLEYLRVLTPVFLFSLNLLAGVLIANQSKVLESIDKLDTKVFIHLTNDNIHIPKDSVVSRVEYKVYQDMRSDQMDEMRKGIIEIKDILRSKK